VNEEVSRDMIGEADGMNKVVVAERPRDALCLSVVSFSSTITRSQSFVISYVSFRLPVGMCGKTIMVTSLPDGEQIGRYAYSFSTACTSVIDGQTDRRSPHDGTGRAYV